MLAALRSPQTQAGKWPETDAQTYTLADQVISPNRESFRTPWMSSLVCAVLFSDTLHQPLFVCAPRVLKGKRVPHPPRSTMPKKSRCMPPPGVVIVAGRSGDSMHTPFLMSLSILKPMSRRQPRCCGSTEECVASPRSSSPMARSSSNQTRGNSPPHACRRQKQRRENA